MVYRINETHNPELKSWVESANDVASDFPIQNLPFGVFRRDSPRERPRIGVAIGDQILDLKACISAELLKGLKFEIIEACLAQSLNPLMSLDPSNWSALRTRCSSILRGNAPHQEKAKKALVPMDEVELLLPARIGNYTDFYASVYHATNVGSMFRPDNPLLPNYKWVPIGYHGRASSIVASGAPIKRPRGQAKDDKAAAPVVGLTTQLDYELEVGFFVGQGNALGEPITIDAAEQNIFGFCLVNDWSARDIQRWEYQPLGPFLAKNFSTTISPWVVTTEALLPFRTTAFSRPQDDPKPLAYLLSPENDLLGGLDLTLEVFLSSARMREDGTPAHRLSKGSTKDLYWTFAQMLVHHTSNGCNIQPGDLLASGTVSGESRESRGCLLELTWRGTEPIHLPTGEIRCFLEDGDELFLKGYCERAGLVRIGFGECRGRVMG